MLENVVLAFIHPVVQAPTAKLDHRSFCCCFSPWLLPRSWRYI